MVLSETANEALKVMLDNARKEERTRILGIIEQMKDPNPATIPVPLRVWSEGFHEALSELKRKLTNTNESIS